MSDSDIDTCGVSQAAAASPIDNGSLTPLVLQPIKDESINADESIHNASKEQPLRPREVHHSAKGRPRHHLHSAALR